MAMFNCTCKCNCTLLAIVASLIIGIVTSFLLITGVITVSDAFLWVVLGIAVVYLAVLLVSTALSGDKDTCICFCTVLKAVLAGILGSALFSVVLLAIGVVAGSTVSAILVGLLLFSLALTLTGSACLVKCIADCE